MEAGWQAFSTERLQFLEEDEEELLPQLTTGLLVLFDTMRCNCITSPAMG